MEGWEDEGWGGFPGWAGSESVGLSLRGKLKNCHSEDRRPVKSVLSIKVLTNVTHGELMRVEIAVPCGQRCPRFLKLGLLLGLQILLKLKPRLGLSLILVKLGHL